MSKLGKIADVCAGQAAPQDSNSFSSSGYPFIRAGSLELLCVGGSPQLLEQISPDVAKKYRLRLFPPDTIVFAKSGMSAKIGRVYRLQEPSYVVSHLAAIIPGCDVDPGYLMHYFVNNPPSRLIPNEAYPSIRLSEIEGIDITLPPLDKQRHIATILDRANAIHRKRQESLRLADDFIKSLFLDMFGSIADSCKMSHYIKKLVSGKSLAGELECVNKVLKTSSISYDYFNNSQVKNLPQNYIPSDEHLVSVGDVLISRMNTAELVGAAAYVWSVQPNIYIPDRLWKTIVTPKANPIFIWQLLVHPSLKKKIRTIAGGTSGSMKNISKSEFLLIDVPCVELKDQNRFANIVCRINKMKTKQQYYLNESMTKCKSLQQMFFE